MEKVHENQIEIELGQNQKLGYEVFSSDTANNHHVLKLEAEKKKTVSIKKDKLDYQIKDVFIRIDNNTDSQTKSSVSIRTFEGKKTCCFLHLGFLLLCVIQRVNCLY